MVAVRPFRAIRYDPRRVELARATSPPHDCFTPAQRDAFLADPRSIVHLTRGKEEPGDGDGPAHPSWHARAGDRLRAWLADGTFVRDASPAFYLYTIAHGPPDSRRTMTALLAKVGLDPSRRHIRPHEATLTHPKRDRLRLREATGADVEPIWLLYRDPRGWVNEILQSNAFAELARLTDEEGHEHRLWRVDRPEGVGEVVAQFEERSLVIADGHHRYQTALDHFAATNDPRHASILAALVRDDDPGLAIQATHRVVRSASWHGIAGALAALPDWTAKPVADPLAELAGLPADGREAVLVAGGPPRPEAFRLRLREGGGPDLGRGRLDQLAVTRVQERILAPWGIGPSDERLRFTRDAEAAVEAVRCGEAAAALLLPPESPHAVLEVALEGQLMPPKATYFVPKLRSGLVLAMLDE